MTKQKRSYEKSSATPLNDTFMCISALLKGVFIVEFKAGDLNHLSDFYRLANQCSWLHIARFVTNANTNGTN